MILPGGAGGYVLDNTGGVNPFAIGNNAVPIKPVLTKRWPGQNFARDFVLIPGSKSGYVVDGYGGLHPFTAPGETTPVVPAGSPYWAGKDIARGLFLLPASTATAPGGYIVDCAAGLTSWGNAPAKAVGGIWSCPAVRSPEAGLRRSSRRPRPVCSRSCRRRGTMVTTPSTRPPTVAAHARETRRRAGLP